MESAANATKEVPSARTCPGCGRPRRVCLCAAMPPTPLRLRGRVMVLQHPLERKKPLGTVQLLRLCVADCTVLSGRRCDEGVYPELEAVLADAAAGRVALYVMFPSQGAVTLAAQHQAAPAAGAAGSNTRNPVPYVLLAIDGTWQQAREIFKRCDRLLPPIGPGVLVQLPDDLPASTCLIRKEPSEGCITTMEACARAVGILEGDSAVGDTILAPLRRLTALQAQWAPAVRQRIAGALDDSG